MKRATRGYTLLEMVVVLSVLAVATAMSAPPTYRMIIAWQESSAVNDVIEQVERLPLRVRSEGIPLEAGTGSFKGMLDLPDGWTVTVLTPLHISTNGVCSTSRLRLSTVRQQLDIDVTRPYCDARRTE